VNASSTGGSAGSASASGSVGGSSGIGGSAGTGAAGGGGAGTTTACGCAPTGGIAVLACGKGFPTFEGRDAPEAMISATGDTVVFNRCRVDNGGSCGSDLVRWTKEAGAVRLDAAWAYAVSADGQTILGDAGDGSTGSEQPVLWTGATRVEIAALAGSYAHLLSADGLVVAARLDTGSNAAEAVLWRADGSLMMLGDLAGGPAYSEPEAINRDGSVVVGYGNVTGGQEPFLWTAESGAMIDLGAVGGVDQTVAYTTSSDGGAVAGTSLTNSSKPIFRWTAAGGMVPLAESFENQGGISAFWTLWTPPILMSDDGKVVAGTTTKPQDPMTPRAFRWTAAAGVASLAGNDSSIVRAASSDGARILGARVTAPAQPGGPPGSGISYAPFIWDSVDGAQDLATLLEASGADLAGLVLGDPIAMSADGSAIVGHATCGADTVVFRAALQH
jgi:probable HAF family extracellular repeat protein